VVKFGEVAKGQQKIYVTANYGGEKKEYSVQRGVHVNVQEGKRLRAREPSERFRNGPGPKRQTLTWFSPEENHTSRSLSVPGLRNRSTALMDGPLNPHDILAVLGEKELQGYLVDEIQEVYRLQGVAISDKHIETIVRQMLRWVKIEEVGDTSFLLEQQIDKFRFREENERVIAKGGRPSIGRPLLLGITKASLSTGSFISAASFQETTHVLTEASINGSVDSLRGLNENVIVGRLIPAGTGMEYYRNIQLSQELEEIAARVQQEGEKAEFVLRRFRKFRTFSIENKTSRKSSATARAPCVHGEDQT
jgi:DNA-directed RNA polymerase subunit beta'